MQTLRDLRRELNALADPAKAAHSKRFFKTGPGEYAEKDRFRGIPVPVLRKLARAYAHLNARDAGALLDSKRHEDRLLALFLLVRIHLKGDAAERGRIHRLYLRKLDRVNNWDLVDSSAEHLIGPHVEGERDALLSRLVKSKDLWRRRVAMLATFYGIKRGNFGGALRIAEALLADSEDLIHKAVGWMLREIGKRDGAVERHFLNRHATVMPRTLLRYAIEKFPERERQHYLSRKETP